MANHASVPSVDYHAGNWFFPWNTSRSGVGNPSICVITNRIQIEFEANWTCLNNKIYGPSAERSAWIGEPYILIMIIYNIGKCIFV